jgi:hypothetical protein
MQSPDIYVLGIANGDFIDDHQREGDTAPLTNVLTQHFAKILGHYDDERMMSRKMASLQ